jgi:phage gp46-like protein
MSDLHLDPTVDGGEISIIAGEPQTTSGLENAVYLSLFTEAWWGNAVSDPSERYNSALPEVMARSFSNQTRLAAIDAAATALQWMLDEGIAASIDIDAEIPAVGVLHMQITVAQPRGETARFTYAVNWDAQEASLR